MKRWIAIAVLASCARSPNPTPVNIPAAAQSGSAGADSSYCDLVLATAKTVVGPYRKDATTLEESCVREVAGANGVIHGEAVGFDPMPTATCRANGWIVQIGETVPQAPTQGILLVGFDDERAGTRTFSARVEKADWRKHPGHFAANGCGSVEGVVRRQGTGWIARVTPEEQ
jgi:hypothetical protein